MALARRAMARAAARIRDGVASATARGFASATRATSTTAARARTGDDAATTDARDASRRARASTTAEIRRLLDMRDPAAAYPLARSMRREITLHVGPTNSGKTYAAMAAVEAGGEWGVLRAVEVAGVGDFREYE